MPPLCAFAFDAPAFAPAPWPLDEAAPLAWFPASVVVAAFAFVSLNMLADVAYALIDPRIGATRART